MSLGFADISALVGLGLTAIGAWRTAAAVMLTEDQAVHIGVARWAGSREENLGAPAVQNLLKQSRGARVGLLMIVGGTVLQMLPLVAKAIGVAV